MNSDPVLTSLLSNKTNSVFNISSNCFLTAFYNNSSQTTSKLVTNNGSIEEQEEVDVLLGSRMAERKKRGQILTRSSTSCTEADRDVRKMLNQNAGTKATVRSRVCMVVLFLMRFVSFNS